MTIAEHSIHKLDLVSQFTAFTTDFLMPPNQGIENADKLGGRIRRSAP
jgi:hypothetical protein